MLYKETINESALELLVRMMSDSKLDNFILAGGTALSLQIGHRVSIDLDLFSNESINENNLSEHLQSNYKLELDFISKNTIKGEINGIKIDCIAHQYPWIDKFIFEENIRLASFKDIAAMKLNAIVDNGTRIKDYIDIAYLSTKLSLNEMLESYEIKYKTNAIIPLKAITYYEDINFNEPLQMLNDKAFNWELIKIRLQDMVNNPEKIYKNI